VNALIQFVTNQIHCSQFNIATFPIHASILTKLTFLVIFFPVSNKHKQTKKNFSFKIPFYLIFGKFPK